MKKIICSFAILATAMFASCDNGAERRAELVLLHEQQIAKFVEVDKNGSDSIDDSTKVQLREELTRIMTEIENIGFEKFTKEQYDRLMKNDSLLMNFKNIDF